MFEVSAAITVPVTAAHDIDADRLHAHVQRVFDEGCATATLFGTTGEGVSLSSQLRMECLRELLDTGHRPEQFIFTLHGNAAKEVSSQIAKAQQLGVTRFLLTPPSYYTDISDAGLYAWCKNIFDRCSAPAQFILYHIPQVTGVALRPAWVAKIRDAYPALVAGIKDTSGSISSVKELLGVQGLQVYVGDERLLARAGTLGATGTICGMANLGLGQHLAKIASADAEDLQLTQLVDEVVTVPIVPAVKALVAHKYDDPQWRRTVPPLEALDDATCARLSAVYDKLMTSCRA